LILTDPLNNTDVNLIEKIKTNSPSMYEQFYQAFNLFNVLKNDILKMLTQAKESMILPEEYITKIKEEFREQGVKEPKNLYN